MVVDQLKGKVNVRQRSCSNGLRLHDITASFEAEELIVGDPARQIQSVRVYYATRARDWVASILAASSTEVCSGSAEAVLRATDVKRTRRTIPILSALSDSIASALTAITTEIITKTTAAVFGATTLQTWLARRTGGSLLSPSNTLEECKKGKKEREQHGGW